MPFHYQTVAAPDHRRLCDLRAHGAQEGDATTQARIVQVVRVTLRRAHRDLQGPRRVESRHRGQLARRLDHADRERTLLRVGHADLVQVCLRSDVGGAALDLALDDLSLTDGESRAVNRFARVRKCLSHDGVRVCECPD